MTKNFLQVVLLALFFFANILAQAPSVDLTIKESSGFLGMGGPRIIKIELSNKERISPLTCENVNSNSMYYFLVSPSNDWRLTEDFVQDDLMKVLIYQNGEKTKIAWKSKIILKGNNSILIGFQKSFKLYLPFLFQYPVDDKTTNQVEFKVPQEYWPDYTKILNLSLQAENSSTSGQFKKAIEYSEQILADSNLSFFPQYEEMKNKRTRYFEAYENETIDLFQKASIDTQTDLKSRISVMDNYKSVFKYIVDSLPRIEWKISSLDSSVAPIITRSQNALLNATAFRDSLQRLLDEELTRWIVEGSATGKNGYLYVYVIEALAYSFSSLNFADTNITSLNVKTPEEHLIRLEKYNILESYNTFLRICNDRYQMRLPIFPVNFLPNLRKDSMSFSLPYYSILKAVNDYYYGNYTSAKKEILQIFKTCYDQNINSSFDMMRIIIHDKENPVPQEVTSLLEEAEKSEILKDIEGAQEKYRQAILLASDRAYSYFLQGKFYARIGDFVRSSYSFQQAFKYDTLYLSAYRECYNIYLKQSNFKEIINIYSTALSKGNNYWEVNYNLGIAYLGEADPARAIQYFQRALALNPKSYKTNIQLGLAYQNVKNYQKAREYFNNAIGLDPTRQEAVDYLSRLNEIQRTAK